MILERLCALVCRSMSESRARRTSITTTGRRRDIEPPGNAKSQSAAIISPMDVVYAFKKRSGPFVIPDISTDLETRKGFSRIRCPLCDWSPTASSLWACQSYGTPEPFFGGCGAMWNTFQTRGRCPVCEHQWRWTSCHRCLRWSLHEDWYV